MEKWIKFVCSRVYVEAVEARARTAKVVVVVVVNAPPMLPPLGVFTQAQSADWNSWQFVF